MAIKLGDAIVFLRGDTKPLEKDLATGEKKTTAWTVAVGTAMGNLMGGVIQKGAELATRAVSGLASGLLKMTMDAAAVEGTRNTFARLAESVGGDATIAMEQLRAATRGMVADADLMQAGNKFLAMGLASTTEEAAKLSEVATQLGMAMGEDATSSMENFALMMANQSIPRLDSFGISSSKVRERIEELMVATEGMTREAAFNQAVMEQAAITMAKVGEQGETSAAKIAGMKATWENLKLAAGQALQPILDAFVNLGSNIVEKWGPKIQEWFEKIKEPIQLFSDAFTKLTSGKFNEFLGSLHDALIALGVPEETVIKITNAISTFESAFQDLKNGNIEEFIGKIKAALVELGVPIGVVNGLEKAFRWVLQAWEDIKTSFFAAKEKIAEFGATIKERLADPIDRLKEAFGNLLKALGIDGGGDGQFLAFLGKLLGFVVDTAFEVGLTLLEIAINALAEAFNAIGTAINWLKENGVFDWIKEQFEKLGQLKLPDWLTPGSPTPFELGLRGITDAMAELSSMGMPQLQAAFAGIGNQTDNRRNMTNYGGVQIYQQPGGGNPLEQLWELGAV